MQYPYPPRDSKAVPDAPKITTADREIRWDVSSAGDVARQARVLGPLWTRLLSAPSSSSASSASGGVSNSKRVIVDEVSAVEAEEVGERTVSLPGGGKGAEVRWVIKGKEGDERPVLDEVPAEIRADKEGEGVLVKMRDGTWLRIGKIKLEGWKLKPAWRVMRDHLATAAKMVDREGGQ
jgi:methionyl-tRNA formyltransferase